MEEKNKTLSAKLKAVFKKVEPKEKNLTAEEVYFKTKYGVYRTPEQEVLLQQKIIKERIKSKMLTNYNRDNTVSSYYCVVDLEDDVKPYANDIFKPFTDGGFDVVNLSEKIPQLATTNSYLVSWLNGNKKW